MKKLISFILASTMILSLSIPAFAAEEKVTADKNNGYKASIDVSGTYLDQLKSDEIISAVVAWEDMNFIYYGSQEGTWNPSEHTYDGDKDAKWNKTTSNITVTNHSNVKVTANLSYSQNVSSVTGSLSERFLSLDSAAQERYMGDNADKAPTATSTFTIGGTMDEKSEVDLGTVTVSLEAGEWTIVHDYDELTDALKVGGNIMLANDIETENEINVDTTFNLNLGKKTLTCKLLVVNGTNCVISNGTIESCANQSTAAVKINHVNATIKNCVLKGKKYFALYLVSANVTVSNSSLLGGVNVDTSASRLTAINDVTVTTLEDAIMTTGIAVKKGCTATFGFDPENLLNGYNKGKVTKNNNGTWTVA